MLELGEISIKEASTSSVWYGFQPFSSSGERFFGKFQLLRDRLFKSDSHKKKSQGSLSSAWTDPPELYFLLWVAGTSV